jgi:hypothetical protein
MINEDYEDEEYMFDRGKYGEFDDILISLEYVRWEEVGIVVPRPPYVPELK